MGSMGRRNFPCSTVNAHTVNRIGARSRSRIRASSIVNESLPPESATATRSPSRIILKRVTASPTFRRSVFSNSKRRLSVAQVHQPAQAENSGDEPGEALQRIPHALMIAALGHHAEHDGCEEREQQR